MTGQNRRILIVAGEASGDLHGAFLARALLRQNPTLHLIGLGGEAMRHAGVEVRHNSLEVGVVGFSELFTRLTAIRRAYRTATRLLHEPGLGLVVLIDCPGFNLRLAAVAKRLGLPVVYYMAPQVWAWWPRRLATIRALVDRLLVALPFEEPYFRGAGIACEWVGHPLCDEMGTLGSPEIARRCLGLTPHQQVLGLLPGSRPQEVARHLPLMLAAATLMSRTLTTLHILVALAPTVSRESVKLLVDRLRFPPEMDIRLVDEDATGCLIASDVALIASGTATLQAALAGTPMIVVYQVSPLTYLIGRRLVRVPHISLANLIAGAGPGRWRPDDRLVPELIQGAATPEAIAAHALRLFTDQGDRAAMRQGLEEVRRRVGPPGASDRAARAILAMLAQVRADVSDGRPSA